MTTTRTATLRVTPVQVQVGDWLEVKFYGRRRPSYVQVTAVEKIPRSEWCATHYVIRTTEHSGSYGAGRKVTVLRTVAKEA